MRWWCWVWSSIDIAVVAAADDDDDDDDEDDEEEDDAARFISQLSSSLMSGSLLMYG